MIGLLALLFGLTAHADAPVDFMLANQMECEGDLTFFVVSNNKAQKINQAKFDGVFKKQEVDSIVIGATSTRPWLKIWPWYGIQAKHVGNPHIPGAELNFTSDNKLSFAVELKFSGGVSQKLVCQLR